MLRGTNKATENMVGALMEKQEYIVKPEDATINQYLDRL